MSKICVIIPALNEEQSIGLVLQDIPKELEVQSIVVDNGSNDNTAKVAQANGAIVLNEVNKGYGFACLKGIEYLKKQTHKPDIVIFLDGDYSDSPNEILELLRPIQEKNYDLVIGSRTNNKRIKGSITVPQMFGNWLATNLISTLYKIHFTDLGPFRAIKYNRLLELEMKDQTYGWTVEMQVKAAKKKFKVCEIQVSYKPRIGKSKISGTVKGTVLAGYKIISTILKYY